MTKGATFASTAILGMTMILGFQNCDQATHFSAAEQSAAAAVPGASSSGTTDGATDVITGGSGAGGTGAGTTAGTGTGSGTDTGTAGGTDSGTGSSAGGSSSGGSGSGGTTGGTTGGTSGSGGTGTGGGGSTVGATPPPAVCDPFGGASSAANQGLVTTGLYYINTGAYANGGDPADAINHSVEGFFKPNATNVGFLDTKIFLQALNFSDMYFTDGFQDSAGNLLKNSAGQELTQYFGFRANSVFVPADWAPGDYQIATLTDDGSILTMSGGQASGADFKINDDGEHSMEMGCTTSVLHVTANSKISMQFDYFQGPPTTIGLMMLYRPVPPGNKQDTLCGKGGDDDTYFFNDSDGHGNAVIPSVAQAPYKQLTGAYNASTGSGGWKVVETSHFMLPGTTTNLCAAQ